jgi:5'(3')-deoxyribonucleotidase
MRIAVDIDNVVEDFQNGWAEEYVLWFDREPDPTRMGQWDALTTATHFETATQFWNWFQAANLWAKLPPVPGAQGGLEWMKAHPHVNFLFVTARPVHGELASRHLANRWNVPVEFRNDTSKHLAKADLWIDDSPAVLANLHAHGKPAIRLERPWNEGAPATFSAPHWPGILDILKELV